MAVIGTLRGFAILETETGQLSLMPLDYLSPDEMKELREHLDLRHWPPQLQRAMRKPE